MRLFGVLRALVLLSACVAASSAEAALLWTMEVPVREGDDVLGLHPLSLHVNVYHNDDAFVERAGERYFLDDAALAIVEQEAAGFETNGVSGAVDFSRIAHTFTVELSEAVLRIPMYVNEPIGAIARRVCRTFGLGEETGHLVADRAFSELPAAHEALYLLVDPPEDRRRDQESLGVENLFPGVFPDLTEQELTSVFRIDLLDLGHLFASFHSDISATVQAFLEEKAIEIDSVGVLQLQDIVATRLLEERMFLFEALGVYDAALNFEAVGQICEEHDDWGQTAVGVESQFEHALPPTSSLSRVLFCLGRHIPSWLVVGPVSSGAVEYIQLGHTAGVATDGSVHVFDAGNTPASFEVSSPGINGENIHKICSENSFSAIFVDSDGSGEANTAAEAALACATSSTTHIILHNTHLPSSLTRAADRHLRSSSANADGDSDSDPDATDRHLRSSSANADGDSDGDPDAVTWKAIASGSVNGGQLWDGEEGGEEERAIASRVSTWSAFLREERVRVPVPPMSPPPTTSSPTIHTKVLIVGAGPMGIKLALRFKKANVDYIQIEQKAIAQTVENYHPSTVMHSSPEGVRLDDRELICRAPPRNHCSRDEYLAHIRSVVIDHGLSVNTNERVLSITKGDRLSQAAPSAFAAAPSAASPSVFAVLTNSSRGVQQYVAHSVVVATGSMNRPRRLNVPGGALPHVLYHVHDQHMFFRTSVLVVGGGSSAIDLTRMVSSVASRVILCHRGHELVAKFPAIDDLSDLLIDGVVEPFFNSKVVRVTPQFVEIEQCEDLARSECRYEQLDVDFVLVAIGFDRDTHLLSDMGIDTSKFDTGEYPPLAVSSSLETEIRGLYLLGNIFDTENYIQEARLKHVDAVSAPLLAAYSNTA